MTIFKPSSKAAVLQSPVAALQFAMGNKQSMHESIVLRTARYLFGDIDKAEWKGYLAETQGEDLVPKAKGVHTGNTLNTTFGKWIYCVVRHIKPDVMVETGVAHGNSSWIILNAIKKNGKGRLVSFDLPNHDTNADYNLGANEGDTGWVVPQELRGPWELNFGDTKETLPAFFKEQSQVDIFFHDSGHSYEHMKFEFEISWPHIRNKGILLSDDVDENEAFPEFVEKHQIRAVEFNKGGCGIKQ